MIRKLRQRSQLPIIHKTELNRAHFLQVVAKTTPEVFQNLRKDVLPIINQLVPYGLVSPRIIHVYGQEQPFSRINLRELKGLVKFIRGDSEPLGDWPDKVHATVESLKQTLSSWADRYQLNRPWVMERALQTLLLGGDPKGGMIERLARPTFEFDGWKREKESKSRYERRVSREFHSHLTRYTKGMQKLVPESHLAGLALYLCRGMKLEEIAKMGELKPRMDRTTVFRHIKSAATELDLPLRKPGKIARV